MNEQKYIEKVYSGLVGKCVGVRLGAPVEPTIWTYERICETYGDIRGYVKHYKTFAADDDVNGPLFFIRALLDYPSPLSAKDIGRTWLNYTREGIGFYWWGGYGRSTEHTAYLNLKAGMDAPLSGSAEVNGDAVAEQIGGQIFIDSWGWVYPEDYRKAAEMAGMAASVGHDRNGIYGGRFIAACISLAFTGCSIEEMTEKALGVIPGDSEYSRVVRAVRAFHVEHPDNWRDAREYLAAEFGYDRYPGVCHIIPNAGVCALALFYGNGDFARTVEIAVMCGWDTDCNAGNVGSVLGVLAGIQGIPERYLRPINDFHAASSISGALNAVSLPKAAKELAYLGLREQGADISSELRRSVFTDDIILDCSLPKSTGGLQSSSDVLTPIAPEEEYLRRGGTVILLDRIKRGDSPRIFCKTSYGRDDFDDERYSPTFTPLAYPGQMLSITGSLERMSGKRIGLCPCVRDAEAGILKEGAYVFPEPGKRFSMEWEIPHVSFAAAEVGLTVMNPDAEKFLGRLVIETFTITGKRQFSIRFSDEREEFKALSRCSLAGGAWSLEDGGLRVITQDAFLLFSGPYYTKDSTVACELKPEYGESHLAAARCRGAESGYCFGLHGNGKAALIKRDHDMTVLEEVPFPWEMGETCLIEMTLRGGRIICRINGRELIDYTDECPLPWGMAGIAKMNRGRTLCYSLNVAEE